MKYVTSFGLLAASAAVASASTNSLPPRSFVKAQVRNSNDLLTQLRDPQVLRAYRTHYGVDRTELEKFFRSLRLKKLGKRVRSLAYHIDYRTNEIGKRHVTMHEGEMVFVSKSGVAMLIARCGNPLGRKAWIPTDPDIGAAAKKKATESAVADAGDTREAAISDSGMSNLPESIIAGTEEIVPSSVNAPYSGPNATDASIPSIEPMELATQPIAGTADPAVKAASTGITGGPLPILLGLGALGWLALPRGGGGGGGVGGNGIPDTPTTGGGTTGGGLTGGGLTGGGSTGGGSTGGGTDGGSTGGGTDPVPEPGSVMAMGAGLALLVLRRRKPA